MARTKYLFHALLLLLFALWTGAVVAAHAVREFYSDDRSATISVPSKEKCSTLLDDSANFEITALGDTKFLIEARAIHEGAALLVVDCGSTMHTYSLNYQNRPKYLFNTDRAFSIQNRPDSYMGLGVYKSIDSVKSGFVEFQDMTYPGVGLLARQSYIDFSKPDKLSRSLDMTHQLPWLDVGYGYEVGENLIDKYSSKRMYVSKLGWSLAGAQTIVNGAKYTQDRYTLFVPTPAALRLSYQRNLEGDTERSVERFWGFFYSKSSHLYTLTHTDAESLKLNTRTSYLDFKHSSEWKVRPEADLGYETRARCPYDKNCILQALEMIGVSTTKAVVTKLKYGIVPHSVSADSRWRFGGNHEVGLGVSKLLEEPQWSKDQKWIASDSFESPLQVRNNIHVEYRNKGLQASLDHYTAWIEPDDVQEPRLQASIAFENSAWSIRTFAGVSYEKPVEKGVFCGLEVRKYFSNNIKRLQLRMQRHTMEGVVRSNIGVGIPDAEITLYMSNKVRATTKTDNNGAYKFKTIPASGKLKIIVNTNGMTQSKNFQKDIYDTSVQVDVDVDSHAEIVVRFVEDVDGSGDINNTDKVLTLPNHVREINEAIVTYQGAIYKGNKIFVKRQGVIELKVMPELLPFDLALKSPIPAIDTDRRDTIVISLLLGKKS